MPSSPPIMHTETANPSVMPVQTAHNSLTSIYTARAIRTRRVMCERCGLYSVNIHGPFTHPAKYNQVIDL